MRQITECPCCSAPISRTIPVVIAPFIRERAQLQTTLTGQLSDCPECGFRCYCDRYDESEIAGIYRGYRDEHYLRQRRKHEPWYTRSVNAAIGGAAEVARRTRRLEESLISCGILPNARRVLDWGGDRGQFIPPGFAERYVYDISGVSTEPGVISVSSSELAARDYDIVLLAHVLEHASDPVALLEELCALPATHLYVEVPFEPLRLHGSHTSPSYSRWVQWIARSPLYQLAAFASVVSRVKFGMLVPLGVLQQHEHINFFTESTLVRMVERVGCRVVANLSYRRHGDSGPIESIGVVARIHGA